MKDGFDSDLVDFCALPIGSFDISKLDFVISMDLGNYIFKETFVSLIYFHSLNLNLSELGISKIQLFKNSTYLKV